MIFHRRSKISFLAGIWLAGVVTLVTLAAQSPTQIHPAPPPPVDRPVNIVVLADGFTSAQEDDFNEAAANFFTYGLLVDGDFEPSKNLLSVKTVFKPVATASASQFGFVIGTGITNCSISWDESASATNTAGLIEAAAAAVNPTYVVVIANYNYNFGCSDDTWTYVTVGAVGEQILQHELGHLLGGLKDEYVVDELETTSFPGVWDTVNCSTLPTPQWAALTLPATPSVTNKPGCALYGSGIVHPYDICRMGVHGNAFCPVCSLEMKKTWDYYSDPAVLNPTLAARSVPANLRISTAGLSLQQPQPQPAQPSPNRQLRLLTSVNRKTGAVSVRTATDVAAAVVPRLRRVGAYVSEVREGNTVIGLEVIAGDPFATHGYRGGGSQHTRVPGESPSPGETASIVVPLPGISRDDIVSGRRAVGVAFYQLSPDVKTPVIDRGAWNDLKGGKQAERIADLTPEQLKAFFVPPKKDDPRPQAPAAPARPPAKEDRPPVKK